MTTPEKPLPNTASSALSSRYRWVTARNLHALVTLVTGILVARSLAVAEFGALTSALAGVAVLTVLVRLGIEKKGRDELQRTPGEGAVILGTAMALRVGAAAFVYLLLAFFAPAGDGDLRTLWLVAGLALLLEAPLSLGAWLAADSSRTGYTKAAERISFGIAAAVRLGLVYNHAPASWFAASLAFEATVAALIIFYAHGRLAPADDAFGWDAVRARQWLRTAAGALSPTLLATSPVLIVQLWLVVFSSSEEAGKFGAAALLFEFTAFALAAVFVHQRKRLEAAESEDENGNTSHDLAAARTAKWMWVAVLLLAGSAHWSAGWVFGADYNGSALPLTLLSGALLPMVAGLGRASQWNSDADLRRTRLAQAAGVAFVALGGGVLIHLWGAVGGALAAFLGLSLTHVGMTFAWPTSRDLAKRQLRWILLVPLWKKKPALPAAPAENPAPDPAAAPAHVITLPSNAVLLDTSTVAQSATRP